LFAATGLLIDAAQKVAKRFERSTRSALPGKEPQPRSTVHRMNRGK
jgi:hypothetical protein